MQRIVCLLLLFITLSAASQTTDKMPGSACNNVVVDTLKGSPDRSASDCEVQFDWKTRMALRDAFSSLTRDWAAKNWIVSDTLVTPLKEVSRSSEKYFFRLSWYFNIDLDPTSDQYKKWTEKYQEALIALGQPPSEATTRKFQEGMYEVSNATHVRIYVTVNDPTEEIAFYKSNHQSFSVAGAVSAIKGSYAAALTGGGEENARDAALIVFGSAKTKLENFKEAGAALRVTSNFPNTSRLTVQSIFIRIECNDALLKEVIKKIDFAAISAMTGH
jgi:hypothetical protein